MDKKVTAILIKATDKGESDKSVRLFTAEEGIITATMKGVRKNTAKLKFAAQPYCIATYELTEKLGHHVVTGATCIEQNYELCTNPSVYATMSVITEIAEKSAQSIDSAKLFVALIKCCKTLLISPESCHVALAKFAQKVLSMSGFIASIKKIDAQPDTPAKLLSFIAYKSLDELTQIPLDQALVVRAVKAILIDYEKTYETQLVSKKVYFSLI